MPKRIVAVTGSRAEYGLFRPVLKALSADPYFDLRIIATGSHLAPEHGNTVAQIQADGFPSVECVESLVASDTAVGVAKSIGLGVSGLGEAYARLKPDVLLLVGDRYEILAAAQAALVAQIPIAHIAGGDVTQNAFDDAIRHCISKMSHLHFATHQKAADRLVQMGEDPRSVFNVGSPAIDGIVNRRRMTRAELSSQTGFEFRATNLMITFHPVTLLPDGGVSEFREMLLALERLAGEQELGMLFTAPNADPASRRMLQELNRFISAHPTSRMVESLGPERYWNMLAEVDVVVGNSSSGLYEAPTLKRAVVNVGVRQSGRIAADCVLNTPAEASAIYDAIHRALELDCAGTLNPYGDGHSAQRIVSTLKSALEKGIPVVKVFHELKAGGAA